MLDSQWLSALPPSLACFHGDPTGAATRTPVGRALGLGRRRTPSTAGAGIRPTITAQSQGAAAERPLTHTTHYSQSTQSASGHLLAIYLCTYIGEIAARLPRIEVVRQPSLRRTRPTSHLPACTHSCGRFCIMESHWEQRWYDAIIMRDAKRARFLFLVVYSQFCLCLS